MVTFIQMIQTVGIMGLDLHQMMGIMIRIFHRRKAMVKDRKDQ